MSFSPLQQDPQQMDLFSKLFGLQGKNKNNLMNFNNQMDPLELLLGQILGKGNQMSSLGGIGLQNPAMMLGGLSSNALKNPAQYGFGN